MKWGVPSGELQKRKSPKVIKVFNCERPSSCFVDAIISQAYDKQL